MPDVIFAGPDGRIEGRYHAAEAPNAPLALVLHAHPKGGGSMNDAVVSVLFEQFRNRGFSVLRFNFRGVGRSQGEFDQGLGELSDAASALDWIQSIPVNANAPFCWVAGHGYGAWIGMQLLMRRPEVRGFIAVAPPMNIYDFSFLAPCPASGLVVNGLSDAVVPPDEIDRMIGKIRSQKDIEITRKPIEGANHFFDDRIDQLDAACTAYLDKRLPELFKE